jgi:hypothetical protein
MKWREENGKGLTYKEVLIEARKSYTPVKRGSGGGTSRMRVAPQPEPTYFTDDDNDDSSVESDTSPVDVPSNVRHAIINNISRLVAENPTMTANDIERHYLSDIRDYERMERSVARRNQVRPASPPVSGGKFKKGGALTARELKRTLNASYDDVPMDATDDFKVDKDLSGKRTKIFHNSKTGQTVVAHRGTASIQDVGTDLGLAVGFRGKRFKHAKKVQKQAEDKYGTENLDTVGHSLAGVIAEEVGKNSRNVITMNKAVVNPTRRNLKNQTDIKTSNDPVSALNRFSNNKAHVIPSQKFNPLKPFKEHTVTTLKRVKKDKQYGR